MPKFLDITGQRFGRLVVLKNQRKGQHNRAGQYPALWLCRCDCGTDKIVSVAHLASGHTRSCGCLQRETAAAVKTKHGQCFTPTWWSWNGMLARCRNVNDERYGGRGITVCERWQTFSNFLEDMGERPTGLTLDRINNNGNYEPGNCRWATVKEQNTNQRRRRSSLDTNSELGNSGAR